jgi:uncharacterized membrane protein
MVARTSHLPNPIRAFRSHPRLCIAAGIGLLIAVLLPHDWRLTTRILVGWDVGVTFYLILALLLVQSFDLNRVQVRADQYDEGGVLVLILTLTAAIASLAAVVLELGAAHAAGPHERLAVPLGVATTLLSWALIQTIFAFHYAHRFYRGPGERGSGLAFPQTKYPNYWDFIYFSFVVGMTFQVSDVQVTSTALRRVVVAHGVLSFFYSVSILALAVNLSANML